MLSATLIVFLVTVTGCALYSGNLHQRVTETDQQFNISLHDVSQLSPQERMMNLTTIDTNTGSVSLGLGFRTPSSSEDASVQFRFWTQGKGYSFDADGVLIIVNLEGKYPAVALPFHASLSDVQPNSDWIDLMDKDFLTDKNRGWTHDDTANLTMYLSH